MTLEINKMTPSLCKYNSCLAKADYEFTDIKKTKPKGSLLEHIETIVIGHACFNHVEEVNKMLKDIHKL